jgi:phthiodiolone/phenolphthiodiolone dimycocerosates ketoreductase
MERLQFSITVISSSHLRSLSPILGSLFGSWTVTILIEFGQQLFFSRSWDLVKKKVAAMVEQQNWSICWVPDHLRGLPPFAIDAFLSPWTMLGAFTELAPDMSLGVAVTDAIRLHPAILAQNAVSLDHQSGGRFILGMGAGEKMNLAVYGFDSKCAVSRLQESIEVMKLLWTQSGPVNYNGRFFHLEGAVLEPKPLSQPHPPIWIAGNGPRTRRLTADLADGWFPFPALPEMYRNGLADIHKHMKAIGRDPSSLAAGFWGRVFMHDDPGRISQYLGGLRGQLVLQPQVLDALGYWDAEYAGIYREQGIQPDEISLLTYDADDVAKLDISKMIPIISDIPEDAIKSITLAGSVEEIRKKIQAFVDAGARRFCFEIINGVSERNAPYTYFDVSRILAKEIYPKLDL